LSTERIFSTFRI